MNISGIAFLSHFEVNLVGSPTSEKAITFDSNMKHHKDMLIKATIAGGGVIPHIHKSLLEKQRAQGESGPAAGQAKSN